MLLFSQQEVQWQATGSAVARPSTAGTADGSRVTGAKLKPKMSQIMDQGCDFEVEMLSGTLL